jgi:hypothetical protein
MLACELVRLPAGGKRGGLMRKKVLGAALMVLLITATDAAANEPWSVTPLTPADGGRYTKSSPTPDGKVGSVAVEFSTAQALPPSTQAIIEINTEPTPGQDGTLADDKRASFGVLYPRDSDPSKWYGSASAGAFLYPGTYYFQVSALVLDRFDDGVQWCPTVPAGSSGLCTYLSPVFTMTVLAPPPIAPPAVTPTPKPSAPTLTLAAARVKAISYARKTWKGTKIKASCARLAAASFRCTVRYTRKKKARRVKVDVYRQGSRLYAERA